MSPHLCIALIWFLIATAACRRQPCFYFAPWLVNREEFPAIVQRWDSQNSLRLSTCFRVRLSGAAESKVRTHSAFWLSIVPCRRPRVSCLHTKTRLKKKITAVVRCTWIDASIHMWGYSFFQSQPFLSRIYTLRWPFYRLVRNVHSVLGGCIGSGFLLHDFHLLVPVTADRLSKHCGVCSSSVLVLKHNHAFSRTIPTRPTISTFQTPSHLSFLLFFLIQYQRKKYFNLSTDQTSLQTSALSLWSVDILTSVDRYWFFAITKIFYMGMIC